MAHSFPRKSLLAALLTAGVALPLAAQAAGTYDNKAATGTTSAPAATAPGATAPATDTSAGASAPASTMAAGASATTASSLSSGDRKFMEKAAQGGVAEVELGKLAAQKGASSEVKQFGQKMADDHAKANDELKQLASRKGVTLPTEMDSSSKREFDKLQKMSGAEFDREYMKTMVSDHQKDVKEFQSEEKSAKDAELKSFVSKTLPTLQDHLNLAKTDEAAVKGNRTTASASSRQTTTPPKTM